MAQPNSIPVTSATPVLKGIAELCQFLKPAGYLVAGNLESEHLPIPAQQVKGTEILTAPNASRESSIWRAGMHY